MAIDTRKIAKARALHETGMSIRAISKKLGISPTTLIRYAKPEKWEKSAFKPKLEQIEHESLVSEAEKIGVTKAQVLAELAIIGFSDFADFVTVSKNGVVKAKSVSEIGRNSRAIKKLRTRTIQRRSENGIQEDELTTEIELHDKRAALVDIGRDLGMFKTETEKVLEAGIFAYYRDQIKTRRAPSR